MELLLIFIRILKYAVLYGLVIYICYTGYKKMIKKYNEYIEQKIKDRDRNLEEK